MRIIKFKVWHKINKKFIFPQIEFWNPDEDINDLSDDMIFLQYTGLKDCKGIEIYEDDLVKIGAMICRMRWYGLDARFTPFTTEAINTRQYIASDVPLRNWNWLNMGEKLNFQDNGNTPDVEVVGNFYEDQVKEQ